MNYNVIAQKPEWFFYLYGLCFHPAGGQTILALQKPMSVLKSEEQVTHFCNWPSGLLRMIIGKWLNICWIIELTDISVCLWLQLEFSLLRVHTHINGCKVGKDSQALPVPVLPRERQGLLSKHSSYMPWTEHCAELRLRETPMLGHFSWCSALTMQERTTLCM